MNMIRPETGLLDPALHGVTQDALGIVADECKSEMSWHRPPHDAVNGVDQLAVHSSATMPTHLGLPRQSLDRRSPVSESDHIHPDDREWAVRYCARPSKKTAAPLRVSMIAADGPYRNGSGHSVHGRRKRQAAKLPRRQSISPSAAKPRSGPATQP